MSLKPAQLKDAARSVINDLIANATQVEVAERVNEAADAVKVLELLSTANVVVRWPNSRTTGVQRVTGVSDATNAALDNLDTDYDV
jgi:hypothetical protein